ncbi:transcription termination factor NusA [candidate division KSB1 bacterium]|nr:transcription termination factor NusA [candidate division KSB1 bacterium]MBL7094880.1 transcription termination factor NusA [candidate division KSB1 bacterium]
MKSDVSEAFSQIIKEKNIDRELLSSIIESIMYSMIRKKYGEVDNFDVFVNMDKGEIEISQIKTIVETVTDDTFEIDLESAIKVEPDLELGDEYVEIVNPASFGRRLIISAKQNLNQKIKEAEKDIIFEEFKNRTGEIVVGDIRQMNRNEIYLNIEGIEIVLPKREQIYNERYRRGDHLRVLIKDVVRSHRGPEIVVSRADANFLVRLFEIEVPEIYDGIIEIKGISREAGDRTKIAVYSNDKRIDAVGACVGMKGVRIQSIVKELNNEKIDIIPWSSEPEIFISRAINPAKPVKIIIDEEEKKAVAVIPDDQISLAIGKGGQNKRIASKITAYEIETIKESDYEEMVSEDTVDDIDVVELEELGKSIISKLIAGGFETVDDIVQAGKDSVSQINGIGPKTVEKIFDLIESLYEE